MVQKLVVNTLATLNTVLSPLAPESTAEPRIQALRLQAECTTGARRVAPLSIERTGESYFVLKLDGELCGRTPATVSLVMNLPTQLLDQALLERLPVGFGFVAPYIPSPRDPSRRERVKFTKLPAVGDLTPVRVEWIPDENGQEEFAPLLIWMGRRPGSSDFVWKRIELSEVSVDGGKPIAVRGALRPGKN